MPTLGWIVASGLLMSALALVGSVTLVLPQRLFDRVVLPLVGLAAGSLLGGALFHMLPEAVDALGNSRSVYGWLALGIVSFLLLEQYLHWHHCHRAPSEHKPVGYLVLVADAAHNLVGGLAVGAPSSSTTGSGSSPGWWPRRTRCRRSSVTSDCSCTAAGAGVTRLPTTQRRP